MGQDKARMRRLSSSSVVALVVVGGLLAFLFWQFHVPSLLFLNTTTAGGDTGSHVALPMYMEQHLLPHGRLTGWDPQWYDGFPAFTFYFPLPSLMVVILHKILAVFLGSTEGYNVAFKLITALGSFALPVAAWAFGRLWGLRNAAAACLAVATLPFLFDRTFTIYGGNIASTLAGEYAFSISLAFGLLFLGVMARGLRTGRHRSLAALLLALTGLCHLLPTLFVLAGAAVLVLMHLSRRALRWSIPTLVVGGLLAGFWWIPFLLRVGYTTDMGWQRLTDFLKILFPGGDQWVAVLAAAGAVLAVVGLRLARRRWADDLGIFLIFMALVSAAAVRFVPQAKIWNARFLPFWEFSLYLLAGLAVAEGGALVGRLYLLSRLRRDGAGGERRRWATPLAVPVLAGLVAVVFVGGPLGAFNRVGTDVGVSSLGTDLGGGPANSSFIPDWIRWNYTGYQQKASYPEYSALIDTMAGLGRKYGCGRAMWEYESEQNRFGTPEALMLLPYWTNDCIDSMEGLLFESASSTPYHFIDQSELSEAPSDAMLGLPYGPVNVTEGIQHLQMLGVKYYLTFSPQIQSQASANPALKLVATSGPWPDQYTTGSQTTTKQITWDIYEIQGSDMVAPLQFEPAVLTSKVTSAKAWLNLSVAWYDNPAAWPVPLAATGPASWPRVPLGDPNPPHVAVPPVTATNMVSSDDRISFDVSRIGSPVVVRASYFPNWQATGAQGPYRITPNLMVVVPTALHVSLHYGWTPVDGVALAATVAGLSGLVMMRHPLPWPEPESPALVGPGPVVEDDDTEEEDHFPTGVSHSVWDGWPFRPEPETAEGGVVEPAGTGPAEPVGPLDGG
ncbi:MAG TPA: 6-pyruvoyl-tetrahydropterin synthase-related protein [Acidimicrobiales bacterium]|nr:6-pyruvoyl-tetrahydropterin synthase-related protein [Acidimicrobiales bacterium]